MFLPVPWLRQFMDYQRWRQWRRHQKFDTDSECVGGFPLFLSRTNSFSNVRGGIGFAGIAVFFFSGHLSVWFGITDQQRFCAMKLKSV